MVRSAVLPRPPLVREAGRARGVQPADAIFRAATAHFASRHNRSHNAEQIAGMFWPDDLVTRAAVSPATVGTSSWAGVLAASAVADFAVTGLAPLSAASELIRRGMRVSLSGLGSITVPRRLLVAADAGDFVAEGEPIRVQNLSVTGGPTLSPCKLAVITVFTNTLAQRAVADMETIVRQMLGEASALVLDSAIFSATAASAGVRPAGLLAGLSSLTPTANGGQQALSEDIAGLIAALTTGTGRNVVIVAAPPQAAALKVWAGPKFDYPILPSAALTTGTVIAVDADSFVSGFGPEPDFSTSDETVLHHEDTTPLAIGTAGAPTTVAAPSRNLFQTDCTAVKMVLRTSWGLRAAGSVAFIDGVTW